MTQKSVSATAIAWANIALIKYWGKRNEPLNLPAVGSISLTLNALKTKTHVKFDPGLTEDIFILNKNRAPEYQEKRISNFLNIIRKQSGTTLFAEIKSDNNFPTGAGLASSASGFAALCTAASFASGLRLSKEALSALSRMGSGSAARSIYGGIVEMQIGDDASGKNDFAVQLASREYWDLRLLVLITSQKEKKISSTDAMNISAKSSPYYDSWIKFSGMDLDEMRQAIKTKDFEKLGELTEFNALKMHALTLSSRPPTFYWNGHTVDLIKQIRELRQKGIQVYFTIDAGPQVKVITVGDQVKTLYKHFASFQGVEKIIESKLGPDAELIGETN